MDTKKYESYKNQLVKRLIDFLNKLNSLEKDYYIMNQELDNSYRGHQIPIELVDKEKQVWKEFRTKKREILREYCTEIVSEAPTVGGSLGKPTQFHFIENDFDLNFIMKTEKRAVIEINYETPYGSCYGSQFIFYPTKEGWRISSIKDRLSKDECWSKSYV